MKTSTYNELISVVNFFYGPSILVFVVLDVGWLCQSLNLYFNWGGGGGGGGLAAEEIATKQSII